MKKLFLGSLVVMFMLAMTLSVAFADTVTETTDPGTTGAVHDIDVSLSVTAGIALTCYETSSASTDHIVNMPAIAQDGTSDDSATCNVRTNNTAGYSLAISGVGALTSGADTIAVYTPAATWVVDPADSAWGYQDVNGAWGVSSVVASAAAETLDAGTNHTIPFRATIGSSHIQPTGTYTDTVTFTATTLP